MTLQEEYEIQILGSLMFDNKYFYQTTLTEKHFTSQERKQGFTLIMELVENDVKVDPFVIRDKLGSVAFEWNTHFVAGGNFEFYHGKLIEFEKDRRLNSILHIIQSKYDPDKKALEIEKILSGLDVGSSGYCHVRSTLGETIEYIDKMAKLNGACSGIATGIDCLDSEMSGLQSEYILIGARPSVGKTSLALTITEYISRNNKIGFFSLEMSTKSLSTRLASMISGVGVKEIRKGLRKPVDFHNLSEAFMKIEGCGLYINDTPNIRFQNLKNEARRMKMKDGIDCLIIDYIGLISPDDTRVPRHEQVSLVSKGLKQLQRELDIPIIALSQLTRDKEEKMPSLSSLRESGSLEQDADAVIFIHRDKSVTEQIRMENNIIPIKLIIAKNRNGPVGTWDVDFNQKRTQFLNKPY